MMIQKMFRSYTKVCCPTNSIGVMIPKVTSHFRPYNFIYKQKILYRVPRTAHIVFVEFVKIWYYSALSPNIGKRWKIR